jgi:diguanylate cyclase (GGDEF)-like protein
MPSHTGRVTLTDELRRERLLDIEARLRRFRIPVFVALGISLIASGPWVGWLWIGPLVPAIGVPVVLYKVMVRSRRPELWAALAWCTSPVIIAVCVVLTGGPDSPGISWFVLTAVTLGARFEGRGVITGLLFTITLMLCSTVLVDPHAAAKDPQLLIMPVGLMFAVSFFSNAVVQSDRDHRLEAIVDPLTGLLNRAALQQRFAELVQQARISDGGTAVGFLVADLDHFKDVNDAHGHAVGDAVLEQLAHTMRNELRAFDLIYRLGGEEFVVVLPGAEMVDALEIAERLRAAVEAARPEGLAVTLSVGVAVAAGSELDFDRLYESADAALYRAKQAGRNCLRVAEPTGDVEELALARTA